MCKTSKIVGRNVATIRAQRKMTQSILAKRSKINQPRISAIEKGVGNPTTETIEAVAKALKVPVIELFQEI